MFYLILFRVDCWLGCARYNSVVLLMIILLLFGLICLCLLWFDLGYLYECFVCLQFMRCVKVVYGTYCLGCWLWLVFSVGCVWLALLIVWFWCLVVGGCGLLALWCLDVYLVVIVFAVIVAWFGWIIVVVCFC